MIDLGNVIQDINFVAGWICRCRVSGPGQKGASV
jgi:hypothetical protein